MEHIVNSHNTAWLAQYIGQTWQSLMLSINLRQPLHTAAKNSPGRPGEAVKMFITKYGISCKDREEDRD